MERAKKEKEPSQHHSAGNIKAGRKILTSVLGSVHI